MDRPHNHEDFCAGQAHGRALLVTEILEEYAGDKLAFLKEKMFQPAATLGKTDKEWAAFGEAVRQVLNVLRFCGSAEEAYSGIIKRSMDVLTQQKFPDETPSAPLRPLRFDNPMQIYCASMGKVFRVATVASTEQQANDFCTRHRDTGVICKDNNGLIYIAELYGSIAPSAILQDMKRVEP